MIPGHDPAAPRGWRATIADRRPWLAGCIAALLAFFIPLGVLAWATDNQPEVRVVPAGGRLSALIVDGDARVLVVNSPDREAAIALRGRMARPWEARPTVLVAPADDDAALGLWESIQGLEPATVIVAGLPGADPLWAAIDAECRERGIELRYESERSLLNVGRLALTVFGADPDTGNGAAVVVRRGGANVVIALDNGPQVAEGQVLVTSAEEPESRADLIVTSRSEAHRVTSDEVVVERNDVVRIVLEEDRLQVTGGALRGPDH